MSRTSHPTVPTSGLPGTRRRLFGAPSWAEAKYLAQVLREETAGGALLLTATVVAMVWANSRWSESYVTLRDTVVGPHALHLDLPLATWAADGLLAIFFLVAGLEVKREFVAGDLRDPRRAALPVVAAVGGVVTPLALYLVVDGLAGGDGTGWAIPVATDIAFALAVLAVVGRRLPAGLRTFLLTLAVVDDLIAIVIIAVFFTHELAVLPLVLALLPLAVFAVLAQRRISSPWLLVPLAVTTWALVHASGVHATVAGMALGFTVPVLARPGKPGPGFAEHLEHRLRPLSGGVAVPVFALLSAGVALGGADGLRTAVTDPVALGVIAGLVVGKPVGVLLATWLVSRFTRARLDDGLAWADVVGLALLSGIGFTVSLLIGELTFGVGSPQDAHAKASVLVASLVSALLAAAVLTVRSAVRHRADAPVAAPGP